MTFIYLQTFPDPLLFYDYELRFYTAAGINLPGTESEMLRALAEAGLTMTEVCLLTETC